MWCRSCRQDVPGLVDGLDGRYACPRCSAVLLSDAGLDLADLDRSGLARPSLERTDLPRTDMYRADSGLTDKFDASHAAPPSLHGSSSAYVPHDAAAPDSSAFADPYVQPVFEPVRPTATEASRVTTLRWDAANWELNEKLRHVDRVTAMSRLRFDAPAAAHMPPPHGPWNPPTATSYGAPYPQSPSLGAHPHTQSFAATGHAAGYTTGYAAPSQPGGPFAPAPYPEPQAPPHSPSSAPHEWNEATIRPEDHWDTPREIFASLMQWGFMGLAVTAFSCGGFLAAWGGVSGRADLQNMGMPIVIVGVVLLVVGLLPLIFLRQVEEEDRRKLEIQERARREMAPSIPAPHSERAPHVHRAPQYASRER